MREKKKKRGETDRRILQLPGLEVGDEGMTLTYLDREIHLQGGGESGAAFLTGAGLGAL